MFNQELATLLKAGMPLVQSLDLLQAARRRRPCSVGARRRLRAGRGRAPRCPTRSRRTATLFPRVYTASLLAGERSGNLEAVLRRYVEYTKIIATVKRKTISALVYPAILISLALVSGVDHRAEGGAGVLGFLRGFGAELPLVTRDHRRASPTFVRGQFIADRAAVVGAGRAAVVLLGPAARAAGAVRSRDPAAADARRGGAEVRDLADGADAGDAARRRHAAGQRARHRRASRSATSTWRGELEIVARARARRRVVRRGARSAAACFRTSR